MGIYVQGTTPPKETNENKVGVRGLSFPNDIFKTVVHKNGVVEIRPKANVKCNGVIKDTISMDVVGDVDFPPVNDAAETETPKDNE